MYEDIRKQFEEVVKYSQREYLNKDIELDFSGLFEQWEKNKLQIRHLLPFFDDEHLIYEYPEKVSFGLDEDTKRERLNRFIREMWDFPFLQDFLRKNKPNFFENRIVEDYAAPRGTARRGMKIIKAFKLFFADDDDENLKRLQAEASAIMNEDKIEGTFCVSIHPLDYISISDNDHNWHTCHAMDSDYRAGNFNYMADKHTVVCYVKTGHDRKISNFPDTVPWNSKKWRVLLFFDKTLNFIMAGKQYPLQSEEALNFFQKAWDESHFEKDGSIKYTQVQKVSPWHKDQVNSVKIDGYEYKFVYPMIPIGHHLEPIHKIYVPGKNTLQYNDILRNETYKKEVRYAYLVSKHLWSCFKDAGITYTNLEGAQTSKYLFAETETPFIQAGEEVYCPHCGLDVIATPEAILCDHCALKYYDNNLLDEDYFPTCEICGNRFIHYEGNWIKGQHVCQICSQEKSIWEDYKEE